MLTEQLTSYEDRVSPMQGAAQPPALVVSLGNHQQASPPPSPHFAPPSPGPPGPASGSPRPPRSPCPSLGREEAEQGRLLQVEPKDAPTRSSMVSLGRELQEISLSTRRDLVEGLDAAPIYDYLVKHGVLDPDTAASLSQERDVRLQNRALLLHIEGVGGKSVPLFINALRQSGQMHLASSLDTTQRIKPVSGKGYWEKQRHKGQVRIKVQILSMKILAPGDDGCSDEKHDAEKDLDAAAMARRQNASYENMTMLDTDSSHRTGRKIQYSYDDDEDDNAKPKNRCLCLCFPMFRKRKKTKEKKYALNNGGGGGGGGGGGSANSSSHPNKDSSHNAGSAPTNGGGDNRFREGSEHRGSVSSQGKGGNSSRSPDKGRKPSSSPRRGGNSKKSPGRSASQQGGERGGGPTGEDWSAERKRSLSPRKEANVSDAISRSRNAAGGNSVPAVCVQNGEDKENHDPIIMEYNGRLELVEMKRLSQVRSSPRSSKLELVEAWRSSGRYFQERAAEFYGLFDRDVQNAVIKYFEQERGTLVLQADSDKQGVYIYNICMGCEQVERLREDYASGRLHAKLERVLLDPATLQALDIRGIQLSSVIEDSEFAQALADLS